MTITWGQLLTDEQDERRAMRSYLQRRGWHLMPNGRWLKPDDFQGYDEMGMDDAYEWAVKRDVQ